MRNPIHRLLSPRKQRVPVRNYEAAKVAVEYNEEKFERRGKTGQSREGGSGVG